MLTYGVTPGGLLVTHKCDVRNCVNPAHLEVGTHKKNAQDMVERNRCNPASGDAHGCAYILRKFAVGVYAGCLRLVLVKHYLSSNLVFHLEWFLQLLTD
ncbi:MAG: HNH endonuclease [Gammaproteobacteria bacterium]